MGHAQGRERRQHAGEGRRSRALTLLGCVTAALLTAGFDPAAQAAQTAQQAADAAFRAGRYDEVESLAGALGAEPEAVLLRARAAAARGDYARAETLLKEPSAARPAGDAALELALLRMSLGRRNEARRSLQLIYAAGRTSESSADALRTARAARALGLVHEANQHFQEAAAQSPGDAAVETHWGELFLEKYDRSNALRSFTAALKIDPDSGPANLGLARTIADDNPPAARKAAQRALEINPSDVAAMLFLAELDLDEDKRTEARERVASAQKVNPNSLEAHALAAAIAYTDGRPADYEQAVAAALAINPLYGEVHRIVGSVTARAYRFDDAVEHVRRAVALDRENTRAHADLGAHLMRAGDERLARRSLEAAWRADRFDTITYNLLELLDKLEKFEVVQDGELTIKLDPADANVMRQYAPALAREALDTLSARWDFKPQGPIMVELFREHDDFAVRNLGLPGMIGALGACFGRVVTMDSPKAREPGTYNWGATLWHEMAHVITLQLSNQRIPRWLTEGISVFEEKRARPEWGREMEITFARALDRGEVLKLQDLNAGFQNPETISLAYYQASLLVEHIVETHGEPALRALVQSFADGIDTEAAVSRVLKVEFAGMQEGFDAFLTARFAGLRAALIAPEGLDPDVPVSKLRALASEHPGSFPVQMALGRALEENDPAAAIEIYEAASRLVPMVTGPDGPQARIAALAAAQKDDARLAQALEAISRQDQNDLEAGRRLIPLLQAPADRQRLREALERVVAVDPFDANAQTRLGRLAVEDGRGGDAIRAFRVALAAGTTDKAAVHADLAEGLMLEGSLAEARKQALAALEVAPTYERAQDLLLKLSEPRR